MHAGLCYNAVEMRLRFVNTTLLTLLGVLTLSGLWGLVFTLDGWAFEVHRWAGWALLALLPWKALVAWRSLRRGFEARFDRSAMLVISLTMAGLLVLVLGFSLMWAWRLGPALIGAAGYFDTAISWHWMLALG